MKSRGNSKNKAEKLMVEIRTGTKIKLQLIRNGL